MFAYEFSRKKLSRVLHWAVALWVLDFTTRVVLYTFIGESYLGSSTNRILGACSGVFAGVAVTLMVIKSKSAAIVPDPEKAD